MQILKHFHLGEGFWEVVRNIGWVTAARAIRMGGALVVGTMVVRYLGPAQYGTFSYAFAIYALFNVVSSLGLDYLVVNDIAIAKEVRTEEEVLGTALLLKASASVITTLAAIGFAWATHPGQHIVILLVAMLSSAAIFQGFDVIDYFFQAKIRSRIIIIPELIVFVLSNAARIFAVLFKCQLVTFGVIAAVEILATEVGFALAYWSRQHNLKHWRFSKTKAVSLLRSSWPLLIASLLIIVYMRTDQILLGFLSTKAVVGQYSAAAKLSEIWYTLPGIICASVMPKLLISKHSNSALYYERIQQLYNTMVILSFSIALLVSLLGKPIVLLLFGSAYLASASVLSVHIWTGMFVFIGVVSSMQLIHENLTQVSLQRSIAGAACNIVLNLLLIPRYGGVGSAVATLVTQCASAYLLDGCDRRTRHIFMMKTRALTAAWIFSRRSTRQQLDAA